MEPREIKYDWGESRLYIFETLNYLHERLEIVENQQREFEVQEATTKSSRAIFSSVWGVVGGVVATVIAELLVHWIFGGK